MLKSVPTLKEKVGLFYDLAFSIDSGEAWAPLGHNALVIPTDRFTNGADKGIQQFKLAKQSKKWLYKRLSGFDHVTFMPFGMEDNDDLNTCKSLSGFMENSDVLLPEQLSLPLVLETIRRSSCIYPYRLHGMVLSYILGAPFEFYPYHWKLNRVYNTIIGSQPEAIKQTQRQIVEGLLERLDLC
jgi:hypothetical protein